MGIKGRSWKGRTAYLNLDMHYLALFALVASSSAFLLGGSNGCGCPPPPPPPPCGCGTGFPPLPQLPPLQLPSLALPTPCGGNPCAPPPPPPCSAPSGCGAAPQTYAAPPPPPAHNSYPVAGK